MLRVTSQWATEWYPLSRIVGVYVAQERGDQHWTVKALLTEGNSVRLLRIDERSSAEAAAGEFAGKVFG